jgi:hypothetical protein
MYAIRELVLRGGGAQTLLSMSRPLPPLPNVWKVTKKTKISLCSVRHSAIEIYDYVETNRQRVLNIGIIRR